MNPLYLGPIWLFITWLVWSASPGLGLVLLVSGLIAGILIAVQYARDSS